jgi:transcription initiation factor TFIIIB Brf1 subunit/transcription initiation factor TFIIB
MKNNLINQPSLPGEVPLICKGCKSPEILSDSISGDLVCTACGEVLCGHTLDMGPEWRSLDSGQGGTGKGGGSNGRERCNASTGGMDYLGEEQGLVFLTGGNPIYRAQLTKTYMSSEVGKDAQRAQDNMAQVADLCGQLAVPRYIEVS